MSATDEELLRIYYRDGQLDPQIIVNEARPKGAPLHDSFEWEDGIAAEKYRLGQARFLIMRVRVIVETEPTRKERVRAFVAIPGTSTDAGGASYRHIVDVAEDDETMKLILQQMDREWRAMLNRYRKYQQFWDLINRTIDNEEGLD